MMAPQPRLRSRRGSQPGWACRRRVSPASRRADGRRHRTASSPTTAYRPSSAGARASPVFGRVTQICCRVSLPGLSQLSVHNSQPLIPMAGVGKLLKQAQKMQRSIEALQTQLEAKEFEVASGGGAVKLKVNGAGKFIALTLDPEFLKEDAKLVAD